MALFLMMKQSRWALEQVIANLLRKGETYKNICNILNTSPKRVSRVAQSLKENKGVPAPLKMGRKKKLIQMLFNSLMNKQLTILDLVATR